MTIGACETPPGRAFYGAIMLAGMVMSCLASARNIPIVLHGGLIDPDSYMRLLRIDQGIAHGRLVNMVQRDDSGSPLIIEWSRLFDGIIVALAAPLAPWLGWHRAVFIAGVATGPLAAGALSAALAFAVRPFSERVFLWTIPLIGLLIPGIRGFAGFGIIHYHIAQIALVALTAGCALRAPTDRGAAWGTGGSAAWSTGISGGFALWMMPETMPFVLLCFLALGYVWLFRPIGPTIRRAGLGFLATLAVALWLDPPHGGFLVAESDRLSIIYVMLGAAVCAAGLWLDHLDHAILSAARRAWIGIAGAFAFFCLWLATYPAVALGPYGLIPPHDMKLFFGHMSETQPVHGLTMALMLLGPGTLALIYGLTQALRSRRDRLVLGAWVILSTGLTLSLALTGRFVIFQQYPAGFAAALLPIALTDATARLRAWPIRAASARIAMICGVLIMPYAPIIAQAAIAVPTWHRPTCPVRHLAPLLAPAAGAVVLTPFTAVPELLYRTKIITVGSLYQHGIAGYLRAWYAWRTPAPDRRAALARTKAAYILFCAGGKHRSPPTTLPATALSSVLDHNDPPPWLTRIGQNRKSGFVLYRIDRTLYQPRLKLRAMAETG